MLRLHRLFLRLGYLDFSRLDDFRLTPDHIDLVLLHQEADAGVQPPGNAARTLHHSLGIEADLAVDCQPIILGVVGIMIDFRRSQQCLGRDAAPVQAYAAKMFPLNDSRLEAKLGSTNGGDITAGTGADDDDVVGIGHDGFPDPAAKYPLTR